MYVNYNKMAHHLFQRAFSDRTVVLNHLGKACLPNDRSSRTQIKSDYPLEDTDGDPPPPLRSARPILSTLPSSLLTGANAPRVCI
jgi:hypothetical protein